MTRRLPEAARTVLRIQGDYDLVGSLTAGRHGRREAHRITTPTEHWRALHTPDGVASLHAVRRGDDLELSAYGSGAEWALDAAPDLLGTNDSGAREFQPKSEPLRSWWRRFPGLRLPRGGSVVEALVPIVLAQKVVGKEAGNSYRRLVRDLGAPAPSPETPRSPGLRLAPTVSQWRTMPYEAFHPYGVERTRAERIRTVARHAKRLEEIPTLPRNDAYRRLHAIRGLGPWSAAKLMFEIVGDADAVWVGDYNLPSFVSWNLVGEPQADDARMIELLQPFAGHRGRVLQLLLVAGRHPPRRAPRQALRRIERS